MTVLNYCRQSLYQIRRIMQKPLLHVCSNCTAAQPDPIDFIKTELDMSDNKLEKFLRKYPSIRSRPPQKIKRSLEILKSLSIDAIDVKHYPNLLIFNEHQLENFYKKLSECGYEKIPPGLLSRYNVIMRQPIHLNKSFDFLPKQVNVVESIMHKTGLGIKLDDKFVYDERISMQTVYMQLMKFFLIQRLDLKEDHVLHLLEERSFSNISIAAIAETIDLLEKELGFDKERIGKAIYLKVYPRNLKNLLDLKRVFNLNIKEVISRCPVILIQDTGAVLEVIKLLQDHRIPDYAVAMYPKVFAIPPQTLKQRLRDISELRDNKLMLKHPNILKIIHYIERIKKRIADIDTEASSICLEKIMWYFLYKHRQQNFKALSYLLNQTVKTIKLLVESHPYWSCVPFIVIERNVNYLLSRHFTTDEIASDIHIIFYPPDRVKDNMELFEDAVKMKQLGLNSETLTKSQKLRLCVYLIEKDCHFTGEGVFFDFPSGGADDDETIEIEEFIRGIFLKMRK